MRCLDSTYVDVCSDSGLCSMSGLAKLPLTSSCHLDYFENVLKFCYLTRSFMCSVYMGNFELTSAWCTFPVSLPPL